MNCYSCSCAMTRIERVTSKIGLEARTFFSTCVSDDDPAAMAKYRIASLAVTVLPAPDSPEMTID